MMKFKVAELIDILTKNRQEHREIFLEAQAGYRQKAVEALEANLEAARNGKEIIQYLNLTVPVDQTSDYDRVLRMLTLTTDEEIELDEKHFANYVMDEWQWSQNFTTSNAFYSAKAASKL
jgi:hypothetical protein